MVTEAYRWLRYAALCKSLHVLPRSGGLLDQPVNEIRRLERMIDAYARYEDREMKISSTRDKNRARHAPTVMRTETP